MSVRMARRGLVAVSLSGDAGPAHGRPGCRADWDSRRGCGSPEPPTPTTIHGLAGNDVIRGGGGNDRIHAGDGNAT